jgi:hypothetical protein
MAVEEEVVVEVDVVWDGEAAEEEVLEVDPGAEEERLGAVVVVVAEDPMVLREEERVEAMAAESDLEHRQ